MATCYPERKRGKLTGKWLAEAFVEGKRVRSRFDTRREGERWADTVKLTGGLPTAPETPSSTIPTFASVATECKTAGGPRRRKWKAGRDLSVHQRVDTVAALIGSKPITSITKPVLVELRNKLAKRPGYHGGPLSAATLNRYMDAASAVLTYAEEQGYIQGKPRVPKEDEDNEKFVWLSEDGERAMTSYMLSKGWKVEALTMRVLIETGLRWGEFESLEPEQIEDEWLRLWKTKTNRPRSSPISKSTARELRAWAAAGALPHYSTFRDRFYAARNAAGQSDDITIHTLRHTTATRLVEQDVPLAIIQRYLGHSTIKTTERYAHIRDELLAKAHKKLAPTEGAVAQSAAEAQNKVLAFQ
jgi:integrase